MQTQFPNDYPAQMKLMMAAYDKMSKALQATPRPLVLVSPIDQLLRWR